MSLDSSVCGNGSFNILGQLTEIQSVMPPSDARDQALFATFEKMNFLLELGLSKNDCLRTVFSVSTADLDGILGDPLKEDALSAAIARANSTLADGQTLELAREGLNRVASSVGLDVKCVEEHLFVGNFSNLELER